MWRKQRGMLQYHVIYSETTELNNCIVEYVQRMNQVVGMYGASWHQNHPFTPLICLSLPWFCRLHREALKQSATDPKTGIIDVGILTTGVSSSERMRRQMLAKELRRLIQAKGKAGSQLRCDAIFEEMKEHSQLVRLSEQLITKTLGNF